MALVIASAVLSDEDFLTAFASCELPLSSFRHGDHLRVAWLYLHHQPFAKALELVRDGIRQFASYHGALHFYHETMTIAWVTLLPTHQEGSFAAFVLEHEHRLSKELLLRFWTPAPLDSDAAKQQWLPPDKHALPG